MDYYGVLNLDSKASSADIKQAYHKVRRNFGLSVVLVCHQLILISFSAIRQLAREYHPDKNPSNEASAKFQMMKLAYAILSDPKRKAQYDEGKV